MLKFISLLVGLSAAAVINRESANLEVSRTGPFKRASTYNPISSAYLNNANVNQISGTFTVPTVTAPSGVGANTSWFIALWPGIQPTNNQYVFQAGVICSGVGTGATNYQYFWAFGDGDEETSGFTNIDAPVPGDAVTVDLNLGSSTSGTFTITNERTGQINTQTVTSQSGTSISPTANNVFFCVEYTGLNGGGSPVPGFSTVQWSGAQLYPSSGAYLLSSSTPGASFTEIIDNGQTYTSTAWTGNGAFTVNETS